MNIILLSGGSGQRLWPLSNDIRSKQFIKLFKKEDGSFESMLQRVYSQILSVCPFANIIIATNKSQASTIKRQLGENVSICVEPSRRDTFPAIVLATSYLKQEKNLSNEDNVVVCPIDHFVQENYFATMLELFNHSKNGSANISLMGVEPTYPSEKYGYIIPENKNNYSNVLEFKEKPNKELAKKYIEQGALWNCGIFSYKINYILSKAEQLFHKSNYNELFESYSELEKISFDYAVVEKEKNIKVLRFSGDWKDVGTWNTLAETMEVSSLGNVIDGGGLVNTHIINELDFPILAMNVENLIISASMNGILVAEKEASSYIKPFVNSMEQNITFAEKSWGNYKMLHTSNNSVTIHITLNAGNKMNYHSHEKRKEVLTVVSGQGEIILDGKKQDICDGDVISIPIGCKHLVYAKTLLQLIEVQIGNEINVDDKIKHDL